MTDEQFKTLVRELRIIESVSRSLMEISRLGISTSW
jgi:hypothetical protein